MKPIFDMNKTRQLLRDIAAIWRWRWEHINWSAILTWTAISAASTAFYISLVIFVCGLFGSCATKRELHEHQTHVVVADEQAQEARHDGHARQTAVDIDSLVTASVWAAMQEMAAQEQSRETTTETITTWTDSLGREMRQEQRTTQRELSRQEQQRWRQTEDRWQNELHQTLRQMDSTWCDRISRYESHLRDSLNRELSKQSETSGAPALTWWERLWQWLKGILAGVAICVAIYLTRRFWLPLIKR